MSGYHDGSSDSTLGSGQIDSGMTLRDYFAAKALPKCLEVCSTNQRAAEEAYIVADAMLEARK
jgi:hypothetical protein